MLSWKIRIMSSDELKANIKACNRFLRVYKDGDCLGGSSCLFCDISYKFHSEYINRFPVTEAKKCNFCLWTIIERESCEDFSSRIFEDDIKNVKSTKRWHKVRIPMLSQWKKPLKAELKTRAEEGA